MDVEVTVRSAGDPRVEVLVPGLSSSKLSLSKLFLTFSDPETGDGLLPVGEVVIGTGATENCFDVTLVHAVCVLQFTADPRAVCDLLRGATGIGRCDGTGGIVDIVGKFDRRATHTHSVARCYRTV